MRNHPAFARAPDRVKVAVNGRWEDAVTADVGAGPLLVSQLDLAGAADVACEAFFGAAFFGVRQSGTPVEMRSFVEEFTTISAAATSGPELFDAIIHTFAIPLGEHFRYCELGAEGAWQSVGPLRIEDPVVALAEPEALWARVCASAVGRDTVHPKALEFTFANHAADTTHWFALPVSAGPQINRVALESALAAYP